jgi:DNA-binding response OmpR family regulator
MHRGSIRVESHLGRGTRFDIVFPRIVGRPPKETPGPQASPAGGEETIIVVEDDPVVGNLVREFLQEGGYKVLPATHPSLAIRVCREHKGPIHLMVTDVVMPAWSGPEVAARFAEYHPEGQVLYISGYAEEALRRQGLDPSRAPVLQKPFTRESLLRKVRETLSPARPAAKSVAV